MNARRPAVGRRTQRPGDASPDLAHELRSSLNGIRTWAHVLRERLGSFDDPLVARALDGIHLGIDQQVRVIEDLVERSAVQPASQPRRPR